MKPVPAQAQRIPELDGIRGIAILLVIGSHYEVFARQIGGLPRFGWVGVDIFFVLSGFLITSVLLKLRGGDDSFKVFYTRRFRRILPPYIIALALIYLLSALQGDHSLYNLREAVRNALFLQSFQVHQTFSAFHQSSQQMWRLAHSPLPSSARGLTGDIADARAVLWSLSIEEYFYLLWAPAVLWMNRKWLAITGIIICLAAFTFRWLAFIGMNSYFSVLHRFDALIFGSFVALLLSSKVPHRALNAILIAAGCFGAASFAAVLIPMGNVLNKEVRDDHVFITFGLVALSFMTASAVGLAAAKSGSRFLFFLRSPALRFIGAISYSLYLFHGLTYLCFIQFFQPTWRVSLTALGCAFAMSLLSWRYVELPILNGGRYGGKSVMMSTDASASSSEDIQSASGEVLRKSSSVPALAQFQDATREP